MNIKDKDLVLLELILVGEMDNKQEKQSSDFHQWELQQKGKTKTEGGEWSPCALTEPGEQSPFGGWVRRAAGWKTVWCGGEPVALLFVRSPHFLFNFRQLPPLTQALVYRSGKWGESQAHLKIVLLWGVSGILEGKHSLNCIILFHYNLIVS